MKMIPIKKACDDLLPCVKKIEININNLMNSVMKSETNIAALRNLLESFGNMYSVS